MKEYYSKAKQLLADNRMCLDKVAEYLIEKETITGKEFMKIFRELKGIPEPEEKSEEEKKEEGSEELAGVAVEEKEVVEESVEEVKNDETIVEEE